MEQLSWILWIVLGVALIVAEIFTLGFVLLWFGLGAIAAAFVGVLGGGFLLQFLAFISVSVGLTAMSRTIFSTYFFHDDRHSIRSGVDAMPGKIGTVSSASNGELNKGAVNLLGSTWTAFPIDGESKLVEGEKVEIVKVVGSSIYVRRITDELPQWRNE